MAVTTQHHVKTESMNPVITGFEDLSFQSRQKRKDELLFKDFNALLDPSKKKLSSLDSQRILSVIDDLILKTEIVTVLPYVAENVDRFSVMLGTDLVNAVKHYDQIQGLYTKALSRVRKMKSSRPSSRGSVRSSESDGDHENAGDNVEYMTALQIMNSYASQLSDVVKNILRLFRLNPTSISAVKNERNERSFEANNLVDSLLSFREQIFARLVTTPGEERDKQRTTVQVMMREKKAQAMIKKLDMELSTSTAEKEQLIYEKNEIIRKLKLNIQTIEQDSDLINRKLVSDAQKIELAEIKNADGRNAKLQQELIQFKQKYQTTTASHRDSELALRRRKYKIETEVENWIQKFDTDMGERQDELDELSGIYAEEKKQLEDLVERFEKLEKEYDQIIEERRIAKEKREIAEKELRSMVKAATLLQSFWRAYRCRKAMKAKQKKGKKGKSGKKKKKY